MSRKATCVWQIDFRAKLAASFANKLLNYINERVFSMMISEHFRIACCFWELDYDNTFLSSPAFVEFRTVRKAHEIMMNRALLLLRPIKQLQPRLHFRLPWNGLPLKRARSRQVSRVKDAGFWNTRKRTSPVIIVAMEIFTKASSRLMNDAPFKW